MSIYPRDAPTAFVSRQAMDRQCQMRAARRHRPPPWRRLGERVGGRGSCLGLAALGLRLGVDALGDAGRLAAAIAQVIELGAPHLAAAHHLDRVDVRRIDREHALDALAVGDLADREALLDAAAGAGDADALVGLHAGALAFLDLDVHDDGVAGLEIRDGARRRSGGRASSASSVSMMFIGSNSCRRGLESRSVSARCFELRPRLYTPSG